MLRVRPFVGRQRRGASAATTIALLAGLLIFAVGGYIVGRQSAPVTTDGAGDAAVQPTGHTDAADAELANGQPVKKIGHRVSSEDRDVSKGPAGDGDYPGDAPWQFEPEVLDFGIVPVGTEVHGQFVLRNISDEPIKLLAMKASCKCTTATDYSGRTIEPGEALTIQASLDSKSYVSASETGIRFLFEGYDAPALVRLKSQFITKIVADPPYLQMDEKSHGVITVRSTDGTPFRITSTGGRTPVYMDFNPATDEPKTMYRILWDFGEYDPSTCHNPNGERMPMWWVVETDRADHPLVDVRVRHTPCTLLDAPTRAIGGRHWYTDEHRIMLGDLNPGQSADFEIYMKWVDGFDQDDGFESAVSLDSDLFEATMLDEWMDDELGVSRARIRITPKADRRGLLYGTVQLRSVRRFTQTIVVIGRVRGDDDVS